MALPIVSPAFLLQSPPSSLVLTRSGASGAKFDTITIKYQADMSGIPVLLLINLRQVKEVVTPYSHSRIEIK